MPVDAGLYGQFAPRVQSPQDYTNALMQQDAMRQSQQLNALQVQQHGLALQQGQQDFADQQKLRAVLQGGADLSTPEGMAAATQAAPMQAQKLRELQLGMAKTQAETAAANAKAQKDTTEAKQNLIQQNASKLLAVNNPDQAHQWIDAAAQRGDISPQQAVQEHAQVPTDPAQFPQYKQAKMLEAVKAHDYLTLQQQQTEEQGRNTRGAATNQTTLQAASTRAAATLGAANISASTSRANNADTLANQRLINGIGPNGTFAGGGDAEQQLNYWADVLKKGGALPPGLARGASGSAFVREVTKRAAMGDTSPTDLMANQAEFVGAKAGQRTLGNRQANIEMAANETANMIPIALAASEKVDRTQFPSLNAVLQAAEKGTGDTNVVQLATATNSLINAYSRAISPSGTPTVSDKEHARDILASAYSKGQYKAAIDIMQQEVEAARKSPKQVRANMRGGASDAPAAASTVVNFSDLK